MNTFVRLLSPIVVLASCGLAAAQETKPVVAQPVADPAPALPAPVWTDPDAQKVGALLTSSWKTAKPIASVGGDGSSYDVVMTIGPVFISDMPNVVYLESARADALNRPFHQSILQFTKVGGKLRMNAYGFREGNGTLIAAYGAGWAPLAMPPITSAALVPTMAYELTESNNTWSGGSIARFPSNSNGAVEMDSTLSISADALGIADRGYDGSGKIVWGPAAGAIDQYVKIPMPVTIFTPDPANPDLFAIDFTKNLEGMKSTSGMQISVHYTGYLDDSKVFDSSWQRGQPFPYRDGQPIIEGWTKMMTGVQKGLTRRLVIPTRFAYGAQGGRMVPPNNDVYFDVEVMSVSIPEPPAPAPAPKVPPAPSPAAVPVDAKPIAPVMPVDPTVPPK